MSAALETAKVTRAMLAAGRSKFAPKSWRPWSEDDLALLTKHYPLRGAEWCRKKLHRSERSIANKSRRLGLARFWSRRELVTLRAEWGEVSERKLRQKLPGRTWKAIAEKAKKLGLSNPNQGVASIKEVAIKSGFNHRRVMVILRAMGVRLTYRVRTQVRPNAARRWVVDLDEALEAIAAWVREQGRRLTLIEAAARTGLSLYHARQSIKLLASTRPVEGYPATVWSVSPEDVDAAAAMYRAARGAR